MINLVRKFVTGYSTVSKNFNGKEYKFSFSNKAVFFDPLFMVKELNSRRDGVKLRKLNTSDTFDSLLERCPLQPEGQIPAVICTIKLEGKELKVFRYVFKDGIYPVSQYIFQINQQVIGQFFRIYDYGHLVRKYALTLDDTFKEEDPEETAWKWEADNGPMVIVEKFGHTQIWCWSGPIEDLK